MKKNTYAHKLGLRGEIETELLEPHAKETKFPMKVPTHLVILLLGTDPMEIVTEVCVQNI